MTNRRAKIAATATVLGLGALGGVALGTNPGVPGAGQQLASSGGSGSIVTSASGASAVPTSQAVAARGETGARAPIVTRASGGGAARGVRFDD
jgi:hypothetical protein